MKAIHGNLRIDQKYSIIGSDYLGKFSDSANACTCQNCGLMITNVVTVKGSIDSVSYNIGIDCASTLTSINPCELSQVKKELSRKARFLKELKTKATSITVHPSESGTKYFRFYTANRTITQWEVFARGTGIYETYKSIIDGLKIPVTFCNK